MRSGEMRRITAAAALVLVVGVAGCSDGGGDDPEPDPTTASAASEAEAIAVVQEYWAERIRVENSGDYASADFEGILDPALVEDMRALYTSFDGFGHRRVGAPELRDHQATVDGSTAQVTMCVNEGPWAAVADIEDVEQPADEFYAVVYPLEQVDGEWLMTSTGENAPEDVTC